MSNRGIKTEIEHDISRRRALERLYIKYMDGEVSYDHYMSTLESNYDVINLKEMEEINQWKKKKEDEEVEKKIRAEIRHIEFEKKLNNTFIVIVISVVAIVWIWTKLKK